MKDKALVQIDAIYAKVPSFDCKQGCSDCCGPIMMSKLEWSRITDRLVNGAPPPSEVQNFGDKVLISTASLTCPLLKHGRCSVYEIRPMICRIFGASEDAMLKCGHGCGAARPLSAKNTSEMLIQVNEAGDGRRYGR